MIKPGGCFFNVLMGRCCLSEIWHYGIRGKFKTAFRRFKTTINFTVNDRTMRVYYYSPGELKKIFQPLFNAKEKHPVGLFIPPSYLEKKFAERTKRLNQLEKMEKRFGYSFLSSFSDHYCIIFKKEPTNA